MVRIEGKLNLKILGEELGLIRERDEVGKLNEKRGKRGRRKREREMKKKGKKRGEKRKIIDERGK